VALVTSTLVLTRNYSPFEGMDEATRMRTSIPRGLLRFVSTTAVAAKPVNDDLLVVGTGSLPPGFAYVISSMSWQIIVDRAADFHSTAFFRIFNGLPNGEVPNEQVSMFDFTDQSPTTAIKPNSRILEYSRGCLREWYPQPLVQTKGAAGMSFTVQAFNANNTVQAAGTQFFNCAFYQYELNQAVRFPLNSPIPMGIR